MAIEIHETDENPVCQHCNEEMPHILKTSGNNKAFERHKFYMCPHCRKVIGVGYDANT